MWNNGDTLKKDNKQLKKKKRFKIKFKVVLITFLILYLLGNIVYNIIDKPISNIYVSGNNYLTDWQVIEMASLDNYPPTLLHLTRSIKNKLEDNILIKKAKVTKKNLTIIYIEVIENRPILYNQLTSKTVLLDKREIDDKFDVPILTSNLDKNKYNELLDNLSNISQDVLDKMSEITYSPDEVDDERFLITMTDGNYVYVTLNKFSLINDYNNIVKEFNNKKGILYLNSGGYFKIMEN